MRFAHKAYENPFPVSIATDQEAHAPRCAQEARWLRPAGPVNSRRMAEPNGRP
jgi:hypothetical protein